MSCRAADPQAEQPIRQPEDLRPSARPIPSQSSSGSGAAGVAVYYGGRLWSGPPVEPDLGPTNSDNIRFRGAERRSAVHLGRERSLPDTRTRGAGARDHEAHRTVPAE